MAVGNPRQSAYSSSASKRPLRSQRRIIPEPSLVGLRRSFVVHIPGKMPAAPSLLFEAHGPSERVALESAFNLGASVASESWSILVPRFVAPHDDKPRVSARGVAAEHAHVFVDRLMRTAGQLALVVEPDLGIRRLEQLE